MKRLSDHDCRLLQSAILEIYEDRNLETFRLAIPGWILKVVPCDCFVWMDVAYDPQSSRGTLVDFMRLEARTTDLLAHETTPARWTHPLPGGVHTGHASPSFAMAEVVTLEQLLQSEFIESVYREWQVRYTINLPVDSVPGRLAALTLCERSRDFTERDRLILELLRPHFNQAFRHAVAKSVPSAPPPKTRNKFDFTPRELEIARWVVAGKSNREVALILRVTPRTVEKHMERILSKMGVENRTTAAVMLAQLFG